MTLRPVHSRYSLPEWQALNLTFFAPCLKKKHFICRLLCLVVSFMRLNFCALFLSEQKPGQYYFLN